MSRTASPIAISHMLILGTACPGQLYLVLQRTRGGHRENQGRCGIQILLSYVMSGANKRYGMQALVARFKNKDLLFNQCLRITNHPTFFRYKNNTSVIPFQIPASKGTSPCCTAGSKTTAYPLSLKSLDSEKLLRYHKADSKRVSNLLTLKSLRNKTRYSCSRSDLVSDEPLSYVSPMAPTWWSV